MRITALLVMLLVVGCTPTARSGTAAVPSTLASIDTAGASAVAESWWRSVTLGDTAYLKRHTSDRLSLTLSNGQTHSRDRLLREAATRRPGPTTFVRPASDVSVLPLAGTAAVTSTVVEGSHGGSNAFRYLTVLERSDSVWQVVAAHSTRQLALTPRVAMEVAGNVSDFAGSYRGGRGGVLQVLLRDSALVLRDPGGGEARLEPIGPALFELPALYDGIAVVRYAFTRDGTGRVVALNRLIYGSVNTWPRVP